MAITNYTLDNNLTDSYTIIQQNGTTITFNTEAKYVEKDIELTVNVRGATAILGGNAQNGQATAIITNVNNMTAVTTTTPSGIAGTDYWSIKATATGPAGSYTPSLTLNQTGWLQTAPTIVAQSVNVTGDSAGKILYIPKAIGSVTMSAGNGECILNSNANITFGSSNTSGVSVGFKGRGAVSATAKITSAGYTETNNSFATGSSTNSQYSDELIKYITGVTIGNSKNFDITIPNGSSTMTLNFSVDSSGNVTIT